MPGLYRHPPQPWQLPPHVIAPPNIASQTPIPTRRSFPAGGSIGSAIRGSYGITTRRRIGVGAITSAAFTLFVGRVGKTAIMQADTLNVTQPLSQSATATFDVFDPTGTYHPLVGQEVLMYQGSLRVFGGTIDEVTELAYPGNSGVLAKIKCTDFSNILDRHVIAKYYTDTQASLVNMVGDIVQTDLSLDGIIYDTSDGNPSVVFGPQLFNWQTIRQIFNTIANIAEWDYNIDYYKVLRFFPRSSGRGTAPFNIADGDSNVLNDEAGSGGTTSLSVRTYRTSYRNRQIVQSSTGQTPVWTDEFSSAKPGPYPASPQPPDGVRIAFVTKYPIIATPVVTVNNIAKRVIELAQIATTPSGNWDWYWVAPNGFGVFQNQAQPALISTDDLKVGYPTQIAPVTTVDCTSQINARAAVEGNSGIYADIQQAANITDPGALTAYAQGLLDRYGCLNGMPTQVIYSTDRSGLFAGMLQTIQSSNPLIASATFQISQVSFREGSLSAPTPFLRYQITADSGRYSGNWTEFFGQVQTAIGLPQPQNRMVYRWPIAPSYPGIVNPGIGGGVLAQVAVIANPFEIFSYLQVGLGHPLTADMDIIITQNGNGVASFTVPSGTSTPQTFYFGSSNVKFPAGTSVQVQINAHGQTLTDALVQLVTTVVVSA